MKKLLPVIGLVILLMLFVAPAASAAPPAWGGDWDGNCGGQYHCVTWGETLYSIGRMYNKHPMFLAQVNGLQNPHRIFAGQVLFIPADGPAYPWNVGNCWGDGCSGNRNWSNDCWGDGCSGNRNWHDNCGGNVCPGERWPWPADGVTHRSGYDFTGYYYEGFQPEYKRYSYTCGYYGNCY
jgi:hypothetical protein